MEIIPLAIQFSWGQHIHNKFLGWRRWALWCHCIYCLYNFHVFGVFVPGQLKSITLKITKSNNFIQRFCSFKTVALKPIGRSCRDAFVASTIAYAWSEKRCHIPLSSLLASCVDSVYLSSGKGNQYRETQNKKHFKWTSQAHNLLVCDLNPMSFQLGMERQEESWKWRIKRNLFVEIIKSDTQHIPKWLLCSFQSIGHKGRSWYKTESYVQNVYFVTWEAKGIWIANHNWTGFSME